MIFEVMTPPLRFLFLFFRLALSTRLFSRLIASINSDYRRKMWENTIEWNWINCIFSYALQPTVGPLPKQNLGFCSGIAIYTVSICKRNIRISLVCMIFLLEIILQTSCNRIRAEMFAERFPDYATHSDILIGYCALPETVRMLVRFPICLQIWLFASLSAIAIKFSERKLNRTSSIRKLLHFSWLCTMK